MGIIEDEVSEFKRLCENVISGSKLVVCLNSLVRVDIIKTTSINLTVCVRFPPNYPNEIILIELKSRTLSSKLLDGLTKLSEEQAKQNRGKPQIIKVFKFIQTYLEEKPLCIVYDEVLALNSLLNGSGELRVKQKQSTIVLTARGGDYLFKIEISIPVEYPEKCIKWETHKSNLPVKLTRYLNGQAKEIARQCVEPPLRVTNKSPVFTPVPSLRKSVSFIIEATRDFHNEFCPICNDKCLPDDPASVIENDTDDDYVERVFCGHLFHQRCLKKYLREPPFPMGGKLCPAKSKSARPDTFGNQKAGQQQSGTSASGNRRIERGKDPMACGIRLSHDRWGMDIKLAEQRWAHQQARERELDEVIDFLQ